MYLYRCFIRRMAKCLRQKVYVNVAILCSLLSPLQLVSGVVKYRLTDDGVLQIRTENVTTWGTVCAVNFDEVDAKVMCRSVGQPFTDARPLTTPYRDTFSPVVLNRLECIGGEESLHLCPNTTIEIVECPGSKVVKVYCQEAKENDMRLMGKYSMTLGRVELFRQGIWGTVHSTNYMDDTWRGICTSLGLPSKTARRITSPVGTGLVWIRDIHCRGNETSWLQCQYSLYTYMTYQHYEDIAISCEDLRYRNELQGFFDGEWWPVHISNSLNRAASVACKVMGLPRSNANAQRVGDLLGPTTVLSVGSCVGTENTLYRCLSTKWVKQKYRRTLLECKRIDTKGLKFRLNGSPHSHVGQLQVFYKDRWGTVCDQGVTNDTAAVACRTLNLPSEAAHMIPTAYIGDGKGDIILEGLTCNGTERSLKECYFNIPLLEGTCYHWDDMTLFCGNSLEKSSLRLSGGKDEHSGRVEIYEHNIWHQICTPYSISSSSFAKVTCRQLGFPSAAAVGTECFEGNSDPFWMHRYSCEGTEYRLDDCQKSDAYDRGLCLPARVICTNEPIDDSECFALDSWVYVVIVAGCILVLIVLIVIGRKIISRRQQQSDLRSDTPAVHMINTPDAPTVQIEPPKYTDSPPSYSSLFASQNNTES